LQNLLTSGGRKKSAKKKRKSREGGNEWGGAPIFWSKNLKQRRESHGIRKQRRQGANYRWIHRRNRWRARRESIVLIKISRKRVSSEKRKGRKAIAVAQEGVRNGAVHRTYV